MNSSVYIFGELSSGYTQYPEDSSSYVLKTLYRHCKAPTQIVIHRDGGLMHYCYIRKLDDDKYIGFCIAVSGYYLSKIDVLFSLFENTIERVVKQGVIIHFSENGTLATSIGVLRIKAPPKPLPIAKTAVRELLTTGQSLCPEPTMVLLKTR